MLGTMGTWDDTKRQQFYPQMRDQVLTAAKRQGLDLSAELPEKFDPVTLDAFIDGSVPVGTQRAQRLTKDHHTATEALGADRIKTTQQGQQLVHEDKQASIAAGNARAAGHDATSIRNTDARLTAGPVVSTTDSSGDVTMPDGTVKHYKGTKVTTKVRPNPTAKKPTYSGW
jgi:cell division septation protein DedD